ncbi:MAG TPA: hypothetical protein VGV35_05295, partial [Bryobacteraceae bacterium]|nr:hypothetical protein [Bryobacteraceae bacterium]
ALLLGSLAIAATGVVGQDAPAQSPPAPQQPAAPQGSSQPQPSPQNQAPPEAPKKETKEESSNPAQYAAEKTVQAAVATREVGKAALFKARDWESGWLTGIFVGTDQPRVPLTVQERRAIYLNQTLATPGAYMKRMFAAGIDQARGAPSQWNGGLGGYGERFASREGQFITANTLAYLGNSALKYEPRYDQCRCSGFWPRTRHAIMRNFLTYDEGEQQLRPQWALYGGSFGGGLVSTAWKPHPRNAFAEGGRAMLGQAGYGTLLNFFIEFSTDINRKIGAKRRMNR